MYGLGADHKIYRGYHEGVYEIVRVPDHNT